jgi:hypothetical protein
LQQSAIPKAPHSCLKLFHELARTRQSLAPDPAYHWTTYKARVFLGALADLGRVSEAARVAGMSRQSAYRLRERLGEGNVFARAWDGAQAEGRAKRRAAAPGAQSLRIRPHRHEAHLGHV